MLIRGLVVGLIAFLAFAEAFGATPAPDQIQAPRTAEDSQALLNPDEIQAPVIPGDIQAPRSAEYNDERRDVSGVRLTETNDDRRPEAPLKGGDEPQATPRA